MRSAPPSSPAPAGIGHSGRRCFPIAPRNPLYHTATVRGPIWPHVAWLPARDDWRPLDHMIECCSTTARTYMWSIDAGTGKGDAGGNIGHMAKDERAAVGGGECLSRWVKMRVGRVRSLHGRKYPSSATVRRWPS